MRQIVCSFIPVVIKGKLEQWGTAGIVQAAHT